MSEKGSGFGRYCYYGCHCLPDKHHNEYLTFGKPVDNIDKQCKQMGVCYKCLQHKYPAGKCQPENTNYKFTLDTVKRTIDCSMNRNTCRRDVCECDKDFAIGAAKHEHEWKEEYHIKRAGFNRDTSCRPVKELGVNKDMNIKLFEYLFEHLLNRNSRRHLHIRR